MSSQQHVSDASPASLSLFSLTAPVAMGCIPRGMACGFLFVQAGASWVMALIASLVIYAGAAQYMMIPMLATGMPISAIALATLLVNLRHVFYGLSLLETFPKGRLLRWYTAFALTDETYSVLTTLPRDTPPQRMALLALLSQGWWVAGSLLGAIIGAQARVPLDGLDFVLCSLFAVLTVEQWRARQSALPLWTALISYALATVLIPDHALVLAIVLSIVTGVFAFKWEDR